ncbi:MAG: major capsid protein, partial [Lysinibacillus sp.]
SFVMFGDGAMGETLFGPTAEENRLTRDPSIETSKIGNVLAMVYEENVDPVSTWTKAVATAIPSFPAADEVFQAQPIA